MIEWASRRGAEPQVPIQSRRHGILLLRALDALQPKRAARPVLYLPHRADHARPDPLTEQARVFGSLVGDGDLRGDSGLLRHFRHAPRFVDRVSQRFLTENVLALLHRGNGSHCVEIIGRADDNCVKVFLFSQQFAEVNVSGASFVLSRALLCGVIPVHDFLRGFASGHTAGHAQRMAQLKRLVGAEPLPTGIDTEQFAD